MQSSSTKKKRRATTSSVVVALRVQEVAASPEPVQPVERHPLHALGLQAQLRERHVRRGRVQHVVHRLLHGDVLGPHGVRQLLGEAAQQLGRVRGQVHEPHVLARDVVHELGHLLPGVVVVASQVQGLPVPLVLPDRLADGLGHVHDVNGLHERGAPVHQWHEGVLLRRRGEPVEEAVLGAVQHGRPHDHGPGELRPHRLLALRLGARPGAVAAPVRRQRRDVHEPLNARFARQPGEPGGDLHVLLLEGVGHPRGLAADLSDGHSMLGLVIFPNHVDHDVGFLHGAFDGVLITGRVLWETDLAKAVLVEKRLQVPYFKLTCPISNIRASIHQG
mmetsp:Transcript_12786/g.20392  ORF Transcript_12786/g.20392 Transcript_12786/m.20392 type:complete len:333 (+) Transcript_12786:476-1474(+)